MSQHYYVLGIDGRPWMLTLEPVTYKRAREMVAWQARGTALESEFAVCTYDPKQQAFVCRDSNKAYKPERAIYTEVAWRNFLANLPVE